MDIMATTFPLEAQVNDEYQGYRYNGTSWKFIGVKLVTEYLTRQQADLLYAPIQSNTFEGGSSLSFTPTSVYDGGASLTDATSLIDGGYSL
jgi:hypothetical protein